MLAETIEEYMIKIDLMTDKTLIEAQILSKLQDAIGIPNLTEHSQVDLRTLEP
jgi:hypothetical protein